MSNVRWLQKSGCVPAPWFFHLLILGWKNDFEMTPSEEIHLINSQEVPSEVFIVNCSQLRNRNNTFEGVFASIPQLNYNSINEEKPENQLNVIVLGFDSLSRVAFERFMPLTKEFLNEELNAVFFDKYTILGDGTPPGKYLPPKHIILLNINN